jgi:membrane-bound lytic murein transglycosylase A
VGLTIALLFPLSAFPQPLPEGRSEISAPVAPAPVLLPTQTFPQLLPDDQIWGGSGSKGDRAALLKAVDHSLRYLQSPRAVEDYRKYNLPGINRDLVWRSLLRFRQLLLTSQSASELERRVRREFQAYQAIGNDGRGTVAFTGYFEPVHLASRRPTAEFRYPIFRLPPNFATWATPHPTRRELEGTDGLQFSQTRLGGLELAWLRDRLEAYLIQVQGSARLQLVEGGTMTVGVAGATRQPYTSLGKELVKEGKIRQEELSLPVVIRYLQANPADLNEFLPRNARFVFFKETGGAPATGSLGVPVTAERAIATDKSIFPPGALALIQTQIPYPNRSGQLEQRSVSRYVLDQDTGSAIRGPGRVDIFMGTGQQAGDRAGLINSPGKLYYLLLKYSRSHI